MSICKVNALYQNVGFAFFIIFSYNSLMPYVKCQKCSSEFYTRPRDLRQGYGKFCSQKCQFESQRNGKLVGCSSCSKMLYRTPRHFKHSKSGHFFCNKVCLAVWKNQNVLSGEQHSRWKHGEHAYRNILKKSDIKRVCVNCGIDNFEVLLVHHLDRNRKNNNISNLRWLCHNCHFLEHRYDNRRKGLQT